MSNPAFDESLALDEKFDPGWGTTLERSITPTIKSERSTVSAVSGGIGLVLEFAERVPPPWAETVVKRLFNMLTLPENWDSYGSARVNRQSIHQAVALLVSFPKSIAAPSIVPAADGGIQLEWRHGTFDLEIEITPSSRILVGIDDPQQGFETFDHAYDSIAQFKRVLLPKIADRIPKSS